MRTERRTYPLVCLATSLLGIAQAVDDGDWLSRHSTLIVSVVSVIFSAFVGPTVTAFLASKRERDKDHRIIVDRRRDDLRSVLDDAAGVLSVAVAKLRPLLAAQQQGCDLPEEPAEFLGSLVPLGQRLRLRLSADHRVVVSYDVAHVALRALGAATVSKGAWDAAVADFEDKRKEFLQAGQAALHGKITDETEI